MCIIVESRLRNLFKIIYSLLDHILAHGRWLKQPKRIFNGNIIIIFDVRVNLFIYHKQGTRLRKNNRKIVCELSGTAGVHVCSFFFILASTYIVSYLLLYCCFQKGKN